MTAGKKFTLWPFQVNRPTKKSDHTRKRSLKLEALEERQMLAITPWEYASHMQDAYEYEDAHEQYYDPYEDLEDHWTEEDEAAAAAESARLIAEALRDRLRGYGVSSMIPALVYGPESMAQYRAISLGWGVRNAGLDNPSLLKNGQYSSAYEVNTLLDVVDPNDGYTSLREAIISANTFAGYDLITFASGLSGTIYLNGTALPTITEGLNIEGPGADVLTIDAGGMSRIFVIAIPSSNDPTPDIPTGLSGVSSQIGDSVTLSWNASANATDYAIYRRLPGGEWSYLDETDQTVYTDFRVVPEMTYEYRLVAANYETGKMSNPSSVVTVTTNSHWINPGQNDWTVDVMATSPDGRETHPEETAAPIVYRFTRSGSMDLSQPLLIYYNLSGTATYGTDYTVGIGAYNTVNDFGYMVIPANQSYIDLSLNIIDDDVPEITESVIMTILDRSPMNLNSLPDYDLGPNTPAQARIVDNDIYANTFVVDTLSDVVNANDGVLSLREAVALANGSSGHDLITFAEHLKGTITLGGTQLVLTDSVDIIGFGKIMISGNDQSRIFYANQSDTTITLDGLTFTNGYSTTNGGAICFSNVSATLRDVAVQDSVATTSGAGIYASDTNHLVIENTLITGNRVSETNGYGGGLYAISCNDVTIMASMIDNNEAYCGGGIYVANSSTVTLDSSLLTDNIARNKGGGIYVTSPAVLSVVNSTISGNKAETASGQTSTNEGGGIYFGGATSAMTLINATITNNSAYLGGGVRADTSSASQSVMHNTIVAGNTASTDSRGHDVYALLNTDSSSNLVGIDTGLSGITNGVNGNLIGTTASPLNPMLSPLRDNGGPTWTHAFLPGSPAIDAGNDNVLGNILHDQRGEGYLRNLGDAVDIGAFEWNTCREDAVSVFNLNSDQESVSSMAAIDVLAKDFLPQGVFATITSATIIGGDVNAEISVEKGILGSPNRDKIILTPTAGFIGNTIIHYTLSLSDGTEMDARVRVKLMEIPEEWNISTTQGAGINAGGDSFSLDPTLEFSPAVTGNVSLEMENFQFVSAFPWFQNVILPETGIQNLVVAIHSTEDENGDWTYSEIVHWSYDCTPDNKYKGDFQYEFQASQIGDVTAFSFEYSFSDSSTEFYTEFNQDESESSTLYHTDTIQRHSVHNIYSEIDLATGEGLASEYQNETITQKHTSHGNYIYFVEGGSVTGIMENSGKSVESSTTTTDYLRTSSNADWIVSGSHNSGGYGNTASSYSGSGYYESSYEESDENWSGSSFYAGTIHENGSGTESYSYTTTGGVIDGIWSITETGSNAISSRNDRYDSGRGDYSESEEETTEDGFYSWEMEGEFRNQSESRDTSRQTTSYTNIYQGGILVGGSTTVSGNTTTFDSTYGSGKYRLLDTCEETIDDVDYYSEYIGDDGRWEETGWYGNVEDFTYSMIYSDNQWNLTSGHTGSTTENDYHYFDECRGTYIETSEDEYNNATSVEGHWGEGSEEEESSTRWLSSVVINGQWQDSGDEYFLESGRGYTDKTVDEGNYTRNTTDPNDADNVVIEGKLGSYEEQWYRYHYEGAQELVHDSTGSYWELVSGSGYNAYGTDTGDSYDGQGEYTVEESSGSGSSVQTWNLEGKIIEKGRIGTGTAVEEQYVVEDGEWSLESVDPTFHDKEEIEFRDEASGTYTNGVMSGTVEKRNSEYKYLWEGNIKLNEENSPLLEGSASETTYYLVENELSGSGSESMNPAGSYGIATFLNLDGIRKETDKNSWKLEQQIEFELDHDEQKIDEPYSWKYVEGKLTETEEISKNNNFIGSGNLTSPIYNINECSLALETENAYSYSSEQTWTLDIEESELSSTDGKRYDVWTLDGGKTEETFSDKLDYKTKATDPELFDYHFETKGDVSFSAVWAPTIPGSFESTEYYLSERSITTTCEYDKDTEKWTKSGSGSGVEKIDNNYFASGTYTSGSITDSFEFTNRYKTDRELTYVLDETQENAVDVSKTVTDNEHETGGSSVTIPTWNSTDWKVSGTGKGEISESYEYEYGERTSTVTVNLIRAGNKPGTKTASKSESFDYTIDFEESRPEGTNTQWEYTSASCDGSGRFEAMTKVEASASYETLHVSKGNPRPVVPTIFSRDLFGTNEYSYSLEETNNYTIDVELDQGKIKFKNHGTAKQIAEENQIYSGSEYRSTENALEYKSGEQNESGTMRFYSEKTVCWQQNDDMFSADVITKETVDASGEFNGEYVYNYANGNVTNDERSNISEEFRLYNEIIKEHSFNSINWNILFTDQYSKYEQQGYGHGSGKFTSFDETSYYTGTLYSYDWSAEEEYNYSAEWHESYDILNDYDCSTSIINHRTGSMSSNRHYRYTDDISETFSYDETVDTTIPYNLHYSSDNNARFRGLPGSLRADELNFYGWHFLKLGPDANLTSTTVVGLMPIQQTFPHPVEGTPQQYYANGMTLASFNFQQANPSKPYTAQSGRNPLGAFGHLGTTPKPTTALNSTATHEFATSARTDYNHLKSEGFEKQVDPDEIHAILFADFGSWRDSELLNEKLQPVADLLLELQEEQQAAPMALCLPEMEESTFEWQNPAETATDSGASSAWQMFEEWVSSQEETNTPMMAGTGISQEELIFGPIARTKIFQDDYETLAAFEYYYGAYAPKLNQLAADGWEIAPVGLWRKYSIALGEKVLNYASKTSAGYDLSAKDKADRLYYALKSVMDSEERDARNRAAQMNFSLEAGSNYENTLNRMFENGLTSRDGLKLGHQNIKNDILLTKIHAGWMQATADLLEEAVWELATCGPILAGAGVGAKFAVQKVGFWGKQLVLENGTGQVLKTLTQKTYDAIYDALKRTGLKRTDDIVCRVAIDMTERATESIKNVQKYFKGATLADMKDWPYDYFKTQHGVVTQSGAKLCLQDSVMMMLSTFNDKATTLPKNVMGTIKNFSGRTDDAKYMKSIADELKVHYASIVYTRDSKVKSVRQAGILLNTIVNPDRPAIVGIRFEKGNNQGHAVVVDAILDYGTDQARVLIRDNNYLLPITVPLEEFCEKWILTYCQAISIHP